MQRRSFLNNYLAFLVSYECKDLDQLAAMCRDDVELLDERRSISGKPDVIAALGADLAMVQTLMMQPEGTAVSGNEVSGSVRVLVDGYMEFKVTANFAFDGRGKISTIRGMFDARAALLGPPRFVQ